MVFTWFLGFNHSFSPRSFKINFTFFCFLVLPMFHTVCYCFMLVASLSFFCVGLYCACFLALFIYSLLSCFLCFTVFLFFLWIFSPLFPFVLQLFCPILARFLIYLFFYRFASFFSQIFSLFFLVPPILSSNIFLSLTLRSIEFYRALRMLRQHMKKNLQSKKPKSRRYGLKPIHKPLLKPILQPIAETHCTLQFDIRIFFSTYRDSMYRYSQHRSDLTGHF